MGIYKKYCLKFRSTSDSFFSYFFFCFSIYKMADSEYSTNIYKSLNINIGTVKRNPEMLRIVSDHLKTKKCVSIQLKN